MVKGGSQSAMLVDKLLRQVQRKSGDNGGPMLAKALARRANKQGQIDRAGFSEALMESQPNTGHLGVDEVNNLFHTFDDNRSGTFSVDSFCNAIGHDHDGYGDNQMHLETDHQHSYRKAPADDHHGMAAGGVVDHRDANGFRRNHAHSAKLHDAHTKIKAALARRGARGIIGLGKVFKIMDDDRSNSLSFSEFEKAMTEYKIFLTDREKHALFEQYDVDGDGTLNYDEFLVGIRGEMNEFRKKLVDQVYRKLDKDGDGDVDADDVKDTYDASAHPDVISGRRTEPDVLREFISTFEIGGQVDGVVTPEEFTNYYNNVSASVDDDTYFAVMMENCWNMKKYGKGWSNDDTSPAKVGQGPLHTRGHKDFADKVGVSPQGSPRQDMSRGRVAGGSPRIQGKDRGDSTTKDRRHLQSEAPLPGGPGAPSGNMRTRNSSAASPRGPVNAGHGSNADIDNRAADLEASAMDKLRVVLAKRGARGIVGLGRSFKIMDDDGSKSLCQYEFKKAISDYGVKLTERETLVLFQVFDKDGNGTVDYEEFLQGIRGRLSPRRLKLVNSAFDKFDNTGDGVVDFEDLKTVFNAKKHPKVQAGEMTEKQCLNEWLDTFEVGETKDGSVTRKEFINYYSNISASIDNDDYFALMMENTWNKKKAAKGWSNDDTSPAKKSGGRSPAVAAGDSTSGGAGSRGRTAGGSHGGLARQAMSSASGRSTANSPRSGAGNDGRPYTPRDSSPFALDDNGPASSPAPTPRGRGGGQSPAAMANRSQSAMPPSGGSGRHVVPTKNAGTHHGQSSFDHQVSHRDAYGMKSNQTHNVVLQSAHEKIQEALTRRGIKGIAGLARTFKIADDDNSKGLSEAEFEKHLKAWKINLTEREYDMLFQEYDQDGGGTIDYEEFLEGIRGPLSANRLKQIGDAFDQFDRTGNGVVDAEDLEGVYNAKEHPDVVSGRRKESEVLNEFLQTFEVGGEVDGNITREEFINYYKNVSASIDDDAYFRQMMTSCWNAKKYGKAWSNKDTDATKAGGQKFTKQNQSPRSSYARTNPFATDTNDKMPSRRDMTNNSAATLTESAGRGEGLSIKEKVQAIIKKRGANGIKGLSRSFRIIDDDGSKGLSLYEFGKAMKDYGTGLSDAEIKTLFQLFDADSSGTMDYEEFLAAMSPPMNRARRAVVVKAFDKFDKDGSGEVNLLDLEDVFDAKKDPRVKGGQKTEREVLNEFLGAFEVGGTVDGIVTRDEFMNYYEGINKSIPNDEYFKLMIDQTWNKKSYGKGWGAEV